MPAPLYDAHCHLPESAAGKFTLSNRISVLNGTEPTDWPSVLEQAKQDPRLIAAIGLHPWKVNAAPENWQTLFEQSLQEGTRAIGEIGLDKWIEDHDMERQQSAFCWQVTQAAKRNLPVSIHCVQAAGNLIESLRTITLPQRGLHLHAFTGSSETIHQLLDLGSYFSFNQKQLDRASEKFRAVIQSIPQDKLLIETDQPLNQADSLENAYRTLSEILQLDFERLTEIIESNFNRFFIS